MEENRLRISRQNTKYMRTSNADQNEATTDIRLGDVTLKSSEVFKYLE